MLHSGLQKLRRYMIGGDELGAFAARLVDMRKKGCCCRARPSRGRQLRDHASLRLAVQSFGLQSMVRCASELRPSQGGRGDMRDKYFASHEFQRRDEVPRLEVPFNWMWIRLGLLLHRIISPIVLTLLFPGCIAPVGLLMRLGGRKPRPLSLDPAAESDWMMRAASGPSSEWF